MIKIRKSEDRGHIQYDWLNTYHSFSFGEYYDPHHMHFQSLRVINEDYIKADSGFPFHSHQDMEILTYIISGQLEHKDSINNTSIISRGELQLMRAGTGITHSEYNSSKDEDVHLLQIWIIPADKGLSPLYQQKNFEIDNNLNKLVLVASPDGQNDSFIIAQDVKVYASKIADTKIDYLINPKRKVWIQLVKGNITINKDYLLTNGDGVAITDEASIKISGSGEFILFDLA
ncbi:MAG: pirin family protein [Neisseriaceae bacterium]